MRTEYPTVVYEAAHELLLQVLRTGLMLTDLFENLFEELGGDAFPGENTGEVLFEMLAGTITPVVDAAGLDATQEAMSLVGAVGDKTLDDLKLMLEMKQRGEA